MGSIGFPEGADSKDLLSDVRPDAKFQWETKHNHQKFLELDPWRETWRVNACPIDISVFLLTLSEFTDDIVSFLCCARKTLRKITLLTGKPSGPEGPGVKSSAPGYYSPPNPRCRYISGHTANPNSARH